MHRLQRIVNGVRKVAAGLRPFNESVWPGVRNDLFIAHESIYRFASRYAEGAAVLDAGCGTGYGSAVLAERAARVTGVDIDPLTIRYARRKYGSDCVHFERADLQALTFSEQFDLVVASNSLEHLDHPERFFGGARRCLRRSGKMIVAVPPIYTDHDAATHGHIHYHRANLAIHQWHDLIASSGFRISAFTHLPASPQVKPDFSACISSLLATSDFVFTPIAREQLQEVVSITAIFVAEVG